MVQPLNACSCLIVALETFTLMYTWMLGCDKRPVIGKTTSATMKGNWRTCTFWCWRPMMLRGDLFFASSSHHLTVPKNTRLSLQTPRVNCGLFIISNATPLTKQFLCHQPQQIVRLQNATCIMSFCSIFPIHILSQLRLSVWWHNRGGCNKISGNLISTNGQVSPPPLPAATLMHTHHPPLHPRTLQYLMRKVSQHSQNMLQW